MNKPLTNTLALFGLLLFLSVLNAAEEKKKPKFNKQQTEIKNFVEQLYDWSKQVNGKNKKKSRANITNSVAWDRIAKDCLGTKNWNKHKSGRTSFQNLLRDVITLTAYSNMDRFWDSTTYTFEKIEIKGKTARVVTQFSVEDEEDYELEYFLLKRGKKWKLYDLSYEDLRYSANINEQLTAFLKEKSFAELTKKMKKKKQSLLDDEKSAKKTKKKKG